MKIKMTQAETLTDEMMFQILIHVMLSLFPQATNETHRYLE